MSIAEKFEVIADAVYEKGKIAQDYEFWKEYQTGTSVNYMQGAFAGTYWTEKTFKPKFDICPTKSATYAFMFNAVQDLDTVIKNAGIKFDLSKCEILTSCFQNFGGIIVPEISTIGTTGTTNNLFGYSSKLVTIKKLILKDDGSQTLTGWFTGCVNLANITFDGVIGQNISFANSPLLTKESLTNIAEHLKDFSRESGTGNIRTIILHDTVKEFMKNDTDGQVIASIIAGKRWGDA